MARATKCDYCNSKLDPNRPSWHGRLCPECVKVRHKKHSRNHCAQKHFFDREDTPTWKQIWLRRRIRKMQEFKRIHPDEQPPDGLLDENDRNIYGFLTCPKQYSTGTVREPVAHRFITHGKFQQYPSVHISW